MNYSNIPKWPFYNNEEIEAAKNVLISGKVNYWTGNETKSFEKNFSDFTGTKYSIALANGSVALTSAYLSLDLKKGDEIITSPRTFVATASSAAIFGAIPIFADVDKETGCITSKTIEPLINNKTKAISVVHLGGWPADMISICNLAESYGIPIVEDCAQAHGAKILYNNQFKSVGGFGDVSAWSFCQDKIISTAGEGGMITTNDKKKWEFIWSLKDHGKNYNLVNEKVNNVGFRWLHESIGTNLRITEVQSAIGKIQLKNIEKTTKQREKNALYLISRLKQFSSLRIPIPSSNIKHAWYRLYVYLKNNYVSSEWNRDRIIHEINLLGYPAFSGSCGEIFKEKCFKDYKVSKNLKICNELSKTSLAFLVHPNINPNQLEKYGDAICLILEKATKK